MITLRRFAYTPVGTFGILTIRDWSCYTVERPWIRNVQRVSCIPEGLYPLRKRRSAVVERSSGGRFLEGWEVCDVPGRTFVMLHPGNTMSDLEGCIAPGEALGYVSGLWAVTRSRDTFAQMMAELDALPGTEHQIQIKLTDTRP